MSRYAVEHNIHQTSEIAVLEPSSVKSVYVYHDGTRIRVIERLAIGDVPTYRGPRNVDVETREEWFGQFEYEVKDVSDVREAVAAIVRETR